MLRQTWEVCFRIGKAYRLDSINQLYTSLPCRAPETPPPQMSFSLQTQCFWGATEVRRRCYRGASELRRMCVWSASEVRLRCVGGASEKQNKIAQRLFGVVPNIETHALQTSNRSPLEIGCFWRVPIALSSFRFFLNPLLYCFENSISKLLQRGIRTCPIFFKKIRSPPNSIDMFTVQFLDWLMKNWSSELKT